MIKREGSTLVNEAAVDQAMARIRRLPGGIEHVSEAVLDRLRYEMEPHDFAALKMDLADYQWLAQNRERLDGLRHTRAGWSPLRRLP
jgi:hypothetical protein